MWRKGNKLFRSLRSAQSCPLPIFVAALGLVIFVTLLVSLCNWEILATDGSTPAYVEKALKGQVLPNPTVGFIKETEIIWQIPSDPKAVLFIAHGCGGSALNFWDKFPGCANCVGLPEETQIVSNAVTQKFAVLVITSTDVCWSYGKDGSKVKEIIRWWLKKHELLKSPLVGLGASSGGYFLSVLATEVKFRGVVLMIASGLFDRMNSIPKDYPPTLFVHMPKDARRRKKIDRHIELLKKKGIETQEIKCIEFAITANRLADRISGLDQTKSGKLLQLFQDKGFIDAKGYMKNDGRLTPWREAVKQSNILSPHGLKLMHHIEEELNLAYAYHEMTSLQSNQIFEWLKSHL